MANLDPIEFPSPSPVAETESVQPATPKKASFQIDTRDKTKGERRQTGERRESIRFEEDRRSHQDRRPQKPGWTQGIDI